MRPRALFVVVFALAIATAASGADAPGPRSPWEGFGVGSWVHLRKSTKTIIPGLSMPEEAAETRETLVRVTEDAHTISRETRAEADWVFAGEFPYPRRAPAVSVPDDGTVPKVEPEAIACRKTRTKVANTVTTTWTSQTHGVLTTETESDAGGGRTTDVRTVTAFARKVKLAGKELVCRETTSFTKMERPGVPSGNSGDGTTGVELVSDAVPGRRVRMEVSGTRGPVSRSSIEELVAFEAKPP